MKKFIIYLGLFAVIGLFATCGKKATPEEEVRNYAKYFVEKLNANQLDSLKTSYPDIVKADSLVTLNSDTIMVVETAPDQFDVTLAPNVMLKLSREEDGRISVTESKGLFAFPADKMGMAKKTGMWNESLTDIEASERLNDEEFFSYLKKSKTVNKKSLISFSDFIQSPGQDDGGNYARDGYHNITNKTDVEIDGSDYSLVYVEGHFWNDESSDGSRKKIKPGKSIPPHGTVRTPASSGYHSWSFLESIKWNLTPEQLQEKFAPFTGNEYQEYLNSKK